MPVVAFVLLWKYVRKDDDNKVKKYLLILYQGLKPDKFYWEFVNTARKILLLLTFLLMEEFRLVFAVSILLITARLQVKLRPYKSSDNNELEIYAITAGLVTIMAGIVYSTVSDNIGYLDLIFLIITIVFNLKFFLEWIYMFLFTFRHKHSVLAMLTSFLAIVMFKKKKAEIQAPHVVEPKVKKQRKHKKLLANGRKRKQRNKEDERNQDNIDW